MDDREATREQLVEELTRLRRRIAELEEAVKNAASDGPQADPTERKKIESALQESEERYRQLTESTTDIIFILDPNGSILYANSSGSKAIGIAAENIVGKRQADLFPPEMAQRHTGNVQKVFATGNIFETDGVYRLGPVEVWLNTRLIPLRNSKGIITAVMGVSRNITERKRAEQVLKRSHDELELCVAERTADLLKTNEQLQIFRQFADASAQGFGIATLDGYVTYVNPTLCRLMGEPSPEHVVGKHFFTYTTEPLRKNVDWEKYKNLLIHQGRWQREGNLLTRQGTVVPVMVSDFLLRDEHENPAYLATIITDITERKEAEKALLQSEEKYRGLIEACPDIVVVIDPEGKILFISRQAWEMCAFPETMELVGKSMYDFVIPQDHDRLTRNKANLLATGVRRYTEYIIARGDGTTFPIEISSAVCRDAEGRPVALMGVLRDITERKHAEETLRKEHHILKHLLESSDHERQLIAYEIHDGLAQHLAGAIMQFQTFSYLKEAKPKEAARAYEAGMTMLQQGHFEARRLISGVRPPVLDEDGVVVAVAHLVHEQNRFTASKIDFRSNVRFDRLAPTLENAIYRIIQEGLSNAAQHSKSPRIRISLAQQEDRLHIEVRDWGVGFDVKAVQENRFGLLGIRQRARLLGGRCRIRSKEGKGTCIHVELPVIER